MINQSPYSAWYSNVAMDSSKTYSQKVRSFLQKYKVKFCTLNMPHNQMLCFCYHNSEDSRRNPYKQSRLMYYPDEICYCSEQACNKFHNNFEKHYHPLEFKKIECQYFNCSLGYLCCFKHQQDFHKVEFYRFDLNTFKTKHCDLKYSHQRQTCIYYHSDGDRRRSCFDQYCHVLCGDKQYCKKKDQCCYSHNKIQQLYHPDRYKTKFCHTFHINKINDQQNSTQKCSYRQFCSFAHRKCEIKIQIFTEEEKNSEDFKFYKYKTIWCPFTQNHKRDQCVYAHNFQDYRRNPKKYKYLPERCEHWNFDSEIKSIEESGCQLGLKCKFSHGWMEQKHHPDNVKNPRKKSQIQEQKKIEIQKEKPIVKIEVKDEIIQEKVFQGAPFFQHNSLDKEVSLSSKKTHSKTYQKTSEQNDEQKLCKEHAYSDTHQRTYSFPIFEDQDKLWRHQLNEKKLPPMPPTIKVRYPSTGKKHTNISYSTSLKDILAGINPYIENELKSQSIHQITLLNKPDKYIDKVKSIPKEKFKEAVLKITNYRNQKEVNYSPPLKRYFEKKKYTHILEKMVVKKVREKDFLNLNESFIKDLSFLTEAEKKTLPKVLLQYKNDTQFNEIFQEIEKLNIESTDPPVQ